MAIETYICIKQTYNRYMGVECWSTPDTVFYDDKNGWVRVGDEVKCERDAKGFYRRIWVNGVLKTEDDYADIHERFIKRLSDWFSNTPREQYKK